MNLQDIQHVTEKTCEFPGNVLESQELQTEMPGRNYQHSSGTPQALDLNPMNRSAKMHSISKACDMIIVRPGPQNKACSMIMLRPKPQNTNMQYDDFESQAST